MCIITYRIDASNNRDHICPSAVDEFYRRIFDIKRIFGRYITLLYVLCVPTYKIKIELYIFNYPPQTRTASL